MNRARHLKNRIGGWVRYGRNARGMRVANALRQRRRYELPAISFYCQIYAIPLTPPKMPWELPKRHDVALPSVTGDSSPSGASTSYP